jgi:hypothetical protein
MTLLAKVPIPTLSWLTASIDGTGRVALAGTIAVQNPSAELGPFFKALHQAASSDKVAEMVVDVTKLTFVNSSAIRLFVDWSTWVRKDAEGHRYKLKFLIDPQITWQKTSFPVLKSLAPGVVVTEP